MINVGGKTAHRRVQFVLACFERELRVPEFGHEALQLPHIHSLEESV
jgi:hypothetical protein